MCARDNNNAPRIAVIGVGNPLMADEGAGIAAIEALKERGLPDGVELIDAGSPGMSLLHMLKDRDAAIIVDAADFEGEPGEVRTFTPDEVRSVKGLRRESLHEADLLQVIELSRSLGELPETVVFIGIQFGKVEMSMEMTDEVKAAVPVVVDEVMYRVRDILGER